jgi:hypothetical protein
VDLVGPSRSFEPTTEDHSTFGVRRYLSDEIDPATSRRPPFLRYTAIPVARNVCFRSSYGCRRRQRTRTNFRVSNFAISQELLTRGSSHSGQKGGQTSLNALSCSRGFSESGFKVPLIVNNKGR